MKTRFLLILIVVLCFGCYNPEDDITSIRTANIEFLQSQDEIIADGSSVYSLAIKLPGIRFGDPKQISLKSTWGLWDNDTTALSVLLKYDVDVDAYVDTVRLKASRTVGQFSIDVNEGDKPIKTLDLNALRQFPTSIQIVADSIALKLMPSNSTSLKAFFFNDKGFPSDGTKFLFSTDGRVNIFPKEVFIDSSESSATLQISTETQLDTIQVYGEIPELGVSQPIIDTLKIALIN